MLKQSTKIHMYFPPFKTLNRIYVFVGTLSVTVHIYDSSLETHDERGKRGSGLWLEIERHVFRNFENLKEGII